MENEFHGKCKAFRDATTRRFEGSQRRGDYREQERAKLHASAKPDGHIDIEAAERLREGQE